MLTLDIISPDGDRQRRKFDAMPVSIGRQVGQLQIQDPGVSALHGQLALINGELCYRDLGSTNGSFDAQGTPIEAPMNLHTGDRVRLGEHEVCLVEFASATAPPKAYLANKTMVYPPSRVAQDLKTGPTRTPATTLRAWQAKSKPSDAPPRSARAPQAPRDVPAPKGTIFGQLNAKGDLNSTQLVRGGPQRGPVPNFTHPISPPPARGVPNPHQTRNIDPSRRASASKSLSALRESKDTGIIESLRAYFEQPFALLASGPAPWLCAGSTLLYLFSNRLALPLLVIAAGFVAFVGLWALAPQSLAASQLLSHAPVTPRKNWIRGLGMTPKTQGRWFGLLVAVTLSSLLVAPIFLFAPFAAPVLLLERKGVFPALRRSASLVTWYPVTAMLPLLAVILSVPLGWMFVDRVSPALAGNGPLVNATSGGAALFGTLALLVSGLASLYTVHVFRVYFIHLSEHDPLAPELDPLRRLDIARS